MARSKAAQMREKDGLSQEPLHDFSDAFAGRWDKLGKMISAPNSPPKSPLDHWTIPLHQEMAQTEKQLAALKAELEARQMMT